MNKSNGLQTGSETTGFRPLGSALASAIGRRHGETGSAVSAIGPARLAAKLAQQQPAETDAALRASLRQRCGWHLEARIELRYPEEGGFERTAVDATAVAVRDAPDRAGALDMLCSAMTPADKPTLARELTRLAMLTKSRDRGDDTELIVECYIEELRRYPADIAVSVLREWPRRKHGTWWPSWHELQRVLEWRVGPRRAMLAAVERNSDG